MVKKNGKEWIKLILFALLFMFLGFIFAGTGVGGDLKNATRDRVSIVLRNTVDSLVERRGMSIRDRVLMENPELIIPFKTKGGFGGDFSPVIALNMFSTIPEAVADADEMTRIEQVADRTWMIYMPFVNSILFETDEGLVLVDSGVAAAGPALYRAIRSVSDKPIHTIIYTHGHVDHAFGTWALVEAGETPQIIAHENLPKRFDRYVRLRGSLAGYMSQPLEQMPDGPEDFFWPHITFDDIYELNVGGEVFQLYHYKGETDDHLFVWIPGREALCSADFYQGFLPNGGNGKRVQRYIGDWSDALQAMIDLKPKFLLPSHGKPISNEDDIRENLTALHSALDFIVEETVSMLNQGMRADEIPSLIELPAGMAEHPTLKEYYVSAEDISKMVIKEYTGWWDGIPSNWNGPTFDEEAKLIGTLAGGPDVLIMAGETLLEENLMLASVVADWALFAYPDNRAVEDMAFKVYKARIADDETLQQERLAYLDHLVKIRAAQLARGE